MKVDQKRTKIEAKATTEIEHLLIAGDMARCTRMLLDFPLLFLESRGEATVVILADVASPPPPKRFDLGLLRPVLRDPHCRVRQQLLAVPTKLPSW